MSNSNHTSALYIPENGARVNPRVATEPGELVLRKRKKKKINKTNVQKQEQKKKKKINKTPPAPITLISYTFFFYPWFCDIECVKR